MTDATLTPPTSLDYIAMNLEPGDRLEIADVGDRLRVIQRCSDGSMLEWQLRSNAWHPVSEYYRDAATATGVYD